jgi:SAM-dependent methyltransferase
VGLSISLYHGVNLENASLKDEGIAMTHLSGSPGRQSGVVEFPVAAANRERVRSVFENAPRYFKNRGVDIRLRIDTIWSYGSRMPVNRGLDIGCGDGTISLQLVTPTSRFTLMDLSSSMMARAILNIPSGLEDNVELRNEDFATADFGSEKFDIIVAVGVMAHVDSPDEFIGKIEQLLAPEGRLILEFTDAYHLVGRLGRMWGWAKEIIAPAPYATNKLSSKDVKRILTRHRLKPERTFRYSRVPIPGFNRIVGHAQEYGLVRAFFGSSKKNRNAWLGNEYICMLRRDQ